MVLVLQHLGSTFRKLFFHSPEKKPLGFFYRKTYFFNI